jgi:hypothetical protein
MKVSRKFFLISLGSLAGILIVYGLLRWKFGAFLPAAVDKNLPDFIMFAAVGIMLWNRKQRSDETKAEAERKRVEAAAAEEAAAEVGGSQEASDDSKADAKA